MSEIDQADKQTVTDAGDFTLSEISGLQNSGELMADLRVAAIPRWFEADMAHSMVFATLNELFELGLVRTWNDGSMAVTDLFRPRLIEAFRIDDPVGLRKASAKWAELFSKHLALEAASNQKAFVGQAHAAATIEMICLSLVAGASGSEERFLEYGLAWKSEPAFALDALRRLLSGVSEWEHHGLVTDLAKVYADFLRLFVEGRSAPAELELEKLRGLAAPGASDRFYGEVLLRAGQAMLALGNWEQAYALLRDNESYFTNNSPGLAESYRLCGRALLRGDDYREAQQYFQKAIASFKGLNMSLAAATSQRGLAEVYLAMGDLSHARIQLTEARVAFGTQDGHLGAANTDVVIANLEILRRDIESARFHANDALRRYEALKHPLGIANALKCLGAVAFLDNDLATASELLTLAIDRSREWKSKAALANALLWLGQVQGTSGDLQSAMLTLGEAFSTFSNIQDKHGLASSLREMGRFFPDVGNFVERARLFLDAITMFREIGSEAETLITEAQFASLLIEARYPQPFSRYFVESLLRRVALTADKVDLPWLRVQVEAIAAPRNQKLARTAALQVSP
ncbi:tetratricopeptide repeat protein [Rhizobium ruizarguesonis]